MIHTDHDSYITLFEAIDGKASIVCYVASLSQLPEPIGLC